MVMPHSQTSSLPPTLARISLVGSPLILVFDCFQLCLEKVVPLLSPLLAHWYIWSRVEVVEATLTALLQRAGSALACGWPKLVTSSALLLSQELLERKCFMSSGATGEVVAAGRGLCTHSWECVEVGPEPAREEVNNQRSRWQVYLKEKLGLHQL